MTGELSRRQFLARAGGFLFLAAGCGGGEDAGRPRDGTGGSAEDAGDPAPEEAGGQAPGDGCGSRTLDHRHGTTEVAGVPERLVSLTPRDQDTILALGTVPVAIRDGFYEPPYASRPWVGEALGGAEPEVIPTGGELNFEQIAALRPDLIAAAGSGITARDYGILSEIAPTVAQFGRYVDYGAPWQEIARTLGRALCREERAEERIAGVEARLRDAREDHPELAGATAVVALPGGPDGSFWIYGPQDSRVRFLTSLGLEVPDRVAELAGDRFAASVSGERMDLLEADLLVWMASPEQREALERDPIYRRLPAAREGRDLFLPVDGTLTAALTNTSVLNLPYLLEELVPRIAAAVAGGGERTEERTEPAGA